MMHESTVVGLSGPCHHQPPTCPRPTPPSVHASLGNQFRFVPIQRALPPVDHPPRSPPTARAAMRETLTQSLSLSRAGQGEAGSALHRHAPARGRGRGQGHGQLRSCWCCSLQEHDGWCESALPHRPSKPIIRMQQPSGRLGMKQTSGPFLPPKPRLRVDITHWMERNLPHRSH